MKSSKIKVLAAAALLSGLVAGMQPTIGAAADITTLDGKTYRNVAVLRTEPDGIIVRFQPAMPGIGMAKLRFRNLPESLQTQFGYDVGKADAFEAEAQQAAATHWQAPPSSSENTLRLYRNLGELRRSLVGDNYSSAVSISVEADGKVSVQDQVQSYGYAWTSGITTDTGFTPIAPYTQFTPYAPYGQYAAFPPYAPYARFAPYSMPNGYRPPLTPTGY